MMQPAFSAERPPRLVSVEETSLTVRRSYFAELIETVFPHGADNSCKPLMFVSTHPGAGVSFTASYVATELALAGGHVLLADATTLLNTTRRPAEEPMRFCERVDGSRLWVMGAKQVAGIAPDHRGKVSSLSSILRNLSDNFTHIVIDAPALSVSGDAVNLAASVYGCVLVAQGERTGRREISSACERFVSLGGRVLGCVYNARPDSGKEGAPA